ncbi:MAG: hypothetical protein GY953_23435, partial [bacterium]|nr:hypothetical protein [bacterium]
MGIPGQFQSPEFLDAIKRVSEAARSRGKAAAVQPNNMEMAEQWIELGYNVISWGADMALYRRVLTQEVAALRERLNAG